LTVNEWERLGQVARQVQAQAGDPEGTTFLALCWLLLVAEEKRKATAERAGNPPAVGAAGLARELRSLRLVDSLSDVAGPEAIFREIERLAAEAGQPQPLSDAVKQQIKWLLAPSILTPELRAWALQQATEEEILTGLREVREKGGGT
jgi:hypothetical protein